MPKSFLKFLLHKRNLIFSIFEKSEAFQLHSETKIKLIVYRLLGEKLI